MPDTIEMKEDGEIESDEGNDEIYKKLDRPQLDVQVNNNTAQESYHSESSASSDTDGETPHKKFMKRLEKPPQAATVSASRSKNGSMWKNMIQEETLMETLKTCDVSSSKKRKFERGAESYDFENHRVSQRDEQDLSVKLLKRRKMDISGNDSSSSNASAHSKKKWKKNNRNRKKPKILADLVATLESSEEDFGREMAQKLEEEKWDLIMKVVSVIGQEASLDLYQITQRIERDGGMLTMNKNRRRTPGGIFLFLLKSSNKIDEDLKKEIFDSQKPCSEKGIAERKMSSEQTEAKDPPNSPANPELTEVNGKVSPPITDLVSQKILNFTKPDTDPPQEEVLELDYNYDDMDTF